MRTGKADNGAGSSKPSGRNYEVRLFQEPPDSVGELTALLHRAYKPLGDAGLNFTATDQTDAVTRRRMARGECYVAVDPLDVIVGTVLLMPRANGTARNWYARAGIAAIGQFAVEPSLQRNGIGSQLIKHAIECARTLGAVEVALDTAAPARHLIDYYVRRGFREVERIQWSGKTYESVVMSMRL